MQTKYDIMQALEMTFPNSSDKDENDAWFVGQSDEGLLTIHFIVDEENTDEQISYRRYT